MKTTIKATEMYQDGKQVMYPYTVKTKGKHPIHMIEGGLYLTEDKRDFGEQNGDMGWFHLNEKDYQYFKNNLQDIEIDI